MQRFHAALREVADLMEAGIVVPLSGNSFPLEQAVEAVQEAVKPGRGGKGFLKSS